MSARVEKTRRSPKTEQRIALAALIDRIGFEAMPCSSCSRHGWKCIMAEGRPRCKECVRRGRSCDGSGVSVVAINRMVAELDRLQRDEEAAADAVEEAQRKASEAVARLSRIRKQRALLRTRGAEMVNRGLNSLDELEAADREESEAAVAAQEVGALGVVDWNAVGLSFLDDPLLGLGSVRETSAEASRSSAPTPG